MSTTALGLRVQCLLEVTFLLNLFSSDTILADLTEFYLRKNSIVVVLVNRVLSHWPVSWLCVGGLTTHNIW